MTDSTPSSAASTLAVIAAQFADLARSMVAGQPDDQVIARVVQYAAAGVAGTAHVGLSVLMDDDPPDTIAATGDVPVLLDELQARAGEGPCIEALVESDIARVDDLASDAQWPRFAAAAVERTTVRSMVSMRLFLTGRQRAVLTFYADRANAFDVEAIATAAIFASYASVIQLNTLSQDKIMHLERALVSNREIGTAIGILMARTHLTREQAFEQLRGASQRLHRKLRDIADEVTLTGELPHFHEAKVQDVTDE